jgi:hypothetical protein
MSIVSFTVLMFEYEEGRISADSDPRNKKDERLLLAINFLLTGQ